MLVKNVGVRFDVNLRFDTTFQLFYVFFNRGPTLSTVSSVLGQRQNSIATRPDFLFVVHIVSSLEESVCIWTKK